MNAFEARIAAHMPLRAAWPGPKCTINVPSVAPKPDDWDAASPIAQFIYCSSSRSRLPMAMAAPIGPVSPVT